MTWWMWLTITLAVYAVGFYRFTIAEAARLNDAEAQKLERERQRYNFVNLDRDVDRRWNMSTAMTTALIWPAVIPARRLATHLDEQAGPTRVELARENDRLKTDIERLEREAGLS